MGVELRQFDLVLHPVPSQRTAQPFLINLQSDLASGLTTVVVAPLIVERPPRGHERLFPGIRVQSQTLYLLTADLATAPRRLLGPPAGNVSAARDAIVGALDLLFTGI